MKNVRKSLMGALALFGAVALTSNGNAACVQSGVECFTLYAGQSIDAGSVCVEIVGDDLVVSYETTGGWELAETHVWAGTTANGWPQNRKGNPVPGQFPDNSGDITGATSYSVTIEGAVADCDGEPTWYLAAHAAVRKDNGDGTYQTETGWSTGPRMADKGNWATYSEFIVDCDCTVTPGVICYRGETAFGLGADNVCFLTIKTDGTIAADADGDFDRWGWTHGPLTDGYSETWELWAGAAKCETWRGDLAGTLTVSYLNGSVMVDFDMDPAWTLEEAHVYAGSEILPRDNQGDFTVTGYGHFTVVDDENPTGSYTIDSLSDSVHVVVHAAVETIIDACADGITCPTKDTPCAPAS